jgi:hypothetical protein
MVSPFLFLPLFTRVRGVRILGSSSNLRSAYVAMTVFQNTHFEGYTALPHGRKIHP